MNKLKLELEGDNVIVVTRKFNAPAEFVYRAHVEEELLRKWMLGPEGCSMPVCISDAKPNGQIRFEWECPGQPNFHLTGHYVSLDPYKRIEHVERMHLPDPTPDNHVTTTFEEKNGVTHITVRMQVPNAEVREAMLATGMDQGMEESYARLESLAR